MTNINYHTLTNWLLPIRLRQPLLLAYLRVLISPIIQTLYPRFKGFEAKAWHDLKYQTGQVAHLEGVLNSRFDAAQKRIWIGPGQDYDLLQYIYTDEENEVLSIFKDAEDKPVYIYTDGETALGGGGNYDFTINVPIGLPHEELTIRAVADRFKRDGKSYIILYFL